MRGIRIFTIITIIGAVLAQDASATITVKLLDTAQIESEFIRLRDIAKVSGDTAQVVRLRNIFFGPTPQVGTGRKITRRQIHARLAEYGLARNLSFTGSLSVQVNRAGKGAQTADALLHRQKQAIAAAQTQKNRRIAALINAFAQKQIGRPGVSLGVRIKKITGRIDDAAATLKVGSLRHGRLPGRATLTILPTGQYHGAGFLTVETAVNATAPVILLRHGIPRGTKLTRENLLVSRQEITPGATWLLGQAKDYIGRVAVRSLKGGIPLRPQDLSKPLAVFKGQQVHVVLKMNRIQISSYAIALSDAAVGEMVRLQNPRNNHKIFSARVTGSGKAEQTMGGQ